MTIQHTTRLGLPYPELPDSADVPRDIGALATALDVVLIGGQGLFADRPVSTPSTPGIVDRYYWATDQSILYRDNGIGWDPITPSLAVDGPVNVGTLRTLGTGHLQGTSGDDPRLSDWRIPTVASVDGTKVHPSLLPSLGAGGDTEALRALASVAHHEAGRAAPSVHGASHGPTGYDPIPFVATLFQANTRANRPTAVSVGDGIMFWATDQRALYATVAGAWVRLTEAAGLEGFFTGNTQTGWLDMQGQFLNSTNPLYAELFAFYGYTIGQSGTDFQIPDGQGRTPVGLGTHTSVNAVNKNDGVSLANRRGLVHQHGSHQHGILPNIVWEGSTLVGGGVFATPGTDYGNPGDPVLTKSVQIGPSGTPVDGGAYKVGRWCVKL